MKWTTSGVSRPPTATPTSSERLSGSTASQRPASASVAANSTGGIFGKALAAPTAAAPPWRDATAPKVTVTVTEH